MLPLRDRNPTRSTPTITILLILVNVAVFLYELSLGFEGPRIDGFIDLYAFDFTKFQAGIAQHGLTLAVLAPLFTHMFLHSGPIHIIGNMLYLWVFGNNIEDRLGPARFILFYFASGVAAALTQGLFSGGPMIGASGAVAGVLGAYLLLYPAARVSTLIFLFIFITIIDLPAFLLIGWWFVSQVLSGVAELRVTQHAAGGVAYFAHIGGFVTGLVLIVLLRPRPRYGAWA